MIADLSLLVFAGALIFARLGAILMLLPGFGEGSIPPRIRLAFALLFALALGPMLAGEMPAQPERPLQIAGLIEGADEIVRRGGLEPLLALTSSQDVEVQMEVLATLCNLSLCGCIGNSPMQFLRSVDIETLISFLCSASSC